MKTRTPLPLSGLAMLTSGAIKVTGNAGAGYGRGCRDAVERARAYHSVPPSPSKETRFDRSVSWEGPL